MAKLTTAGRNRISGKNFALAGRRYPIEDPNHARNALARVSQYGSSEEQEEVRRKVHAKYPGIGRSPGGYVVNPTHSMHDLHRNAPEKYRQGSNRQEWEASSADRAQTRLAGGYVPNPRQNAAIHAQDAHPRMHALSIGSATHLRNMGHITPEHHARIVQASDTAMANAKRNQPATASQQPAMQPFGSFAPPDTAGYG